MGYGRSGSTLFESLLVDEYNLNAFGEIKYLPERGVIKNELCSCGECAQNCIYWAKVLDRIGDWDYKKLSQLTMKFESSKMFFVNLILIKFGFQRKSLRYYQQFNHLLLNILEEDGSFIDSSKMPARFYFLNYKVNQKAYSKVYWLTRDPRGVAYSCMKAVKRPEATSASEQFMPQFGLISSLLKWNFNTMVAIYIKRRFKNQIEHVQYEAIVDRKWSKSSSNFEPVRHSISGNPRRFTGGLTKIKVDDKWKSSFGRITKLVAIFITYPLLKAAGYRK